MKTTESKEALAPQRFFFGRLPPCPFRTAFLPQFLKFVEVTRMEAADAQKVRLAHRRNESAGAQSSGG